MADIFKRLVNLAKSEISHLKYPDLKLSDEFVHYFRQQPDFEKYRDYFEAEYQRQTGESYRQTHGRDERTKYSENQGYDPYKTLEVSPDASFEEIEKAYRKMARKYHPDRYREESERETATKVMALVNASFQFLKQKHGKK